jgi:hypothetical protein
MLAALLLVVKIAILGATWALIGWLLLPRRFRRHADRLLSWTTAFGLGTGATAFVLTSMAALHLLRRAPVQRLALVELVIALAVAWVCRRELWADLGRLRGGSGIAKLAGWSLALMLALTLVATLAPPSAMDATIYHLRVAAEFVRTGTWTRLEQVQSFQPLYVEMLFAEALVLGGAPLAALVHWLLGVGAMASAACWARRLGGRAIWGAVAFGATALYVWEATSTFIDLGLALFSSLSLLWAIAGELDLATALLAGVFGGLAGGSKFTGLETAALCAVLAFAAQWPEVWRGLQRMVVIGVVALAVASPWYLRNWSMTGNPIYPLANPLFGLPAREFSTFVYGLGTDPLHLLSSPFDLLARGDKFDQGWSLGPVYLAFVPLGVLLVRSRLAKLLVACIVGWWIIWFYSSPQTRILLPILPPAAGLAAVGIGALLSSPRVSLRIGALVILGIAVAGALGTAALYLKINGRVLVGRESRDAYLSRHSWNYVAYERANSLLPADARVASVGFGDNLYYLDRPAVWLGKAPRSTADLEAAGFTHELQISYCPLAPLDNPGRAVLASGSYDLRASRLSGGVYATACFRLSAVSPQR